MVTVSFSLGGGHSGSFSVEAARHWKRRTSAALAKSCRLRMSAASFSFCALPWLALHGPTCLCTMSSSKHTGSASSAHACSSLCPSLHLLLTHLGSTTPSMPVSHCISPASCSLLAYCGSTTDVTRASRFCISLSSPASPNMARREAPWCWIDSSLYALMCCTVNASPALSFRTPSSGVPPHPDSKRSSHCRRAFRGSKSPEASSSKPASSRVPQPNHPARGATHTFFTE
mmetsp:Transcript_44311/g.106471  ORF Transcript_44311/g.106471 Transcript_44311/m.106471 type:complete len:230 (+) Transcript_44311:608-1297(+)